MVDQHEQVHATKPGANDPPGTVRLEDGHGATSLFPVPSDDPNDPLNWSTLRKYVHFGLVCYYVLWTFIELQISYPAWNAMHNDLGYSFSLLNNSTAVNYIGLGIGCIFGIPIVYRYGRRCTYIISITLQFAGAIWAAVQQHPGDAYGWNLITGLGGALSEIVAQITIADIFFLHQRGASNGWYLLANTAGDFIGPVIGGYVTAGQNWRWVFWWSAIFLGLGVVAVLFFFEESKYVPPAAYHGRADAATDSCTEPPPSASNASPNEVDSKSELARLEPSRTISIGIAVPAAKSYFERLQLVTKSPPGTEMPYFHRIYQPLILLFTFPAVMYTALAYGMLIAWISVINSIQTTYLPMEPYNFSSSAVGLMNLPAFVGAILGCFVGGWLNDKLTMHFAKRNGGVFEPEQRLWLNFAATVSVPASCLMFGLSLAAGAHWSIPAVAYGIFGFGLVVGCDVALSYTTDCYQDIIGDALVGVVLVRNAISAGVSFGLTPWVTAMGVRNVFITMAVISLVNLLLPIGLLKWGKQFRIRTEAEYRKMALRQPGQRCF